MSALLVIASSILTSVSVLVLISLGLALIFGLMKIVNMAHGEFIMVGAFTVVSLVRFMNCPLWIAVLLAGVASAILGAVVERTLVRPLYKLRLVDTLLVTFGLSLVLFQLAVDIFGTTSPGISTPLGAISVGEYSLSVYSAVVLPCSAVAVIGALYLIFTKTRYGLLARATAQNPEMASALGVFAPRVNLLTFSLGCGIAGLAGGLIAPVVAVSPSLGQAYVAQAFMAVVTGGPAFLMGSVASSALLGSIANIVSQVLTTLWGVAALLLAAMFIIRFMPRGLSASWTRKF
ncbi:branched-chain amino acid ABC transporter permease [Burkholderia sp. THE68]|uniref:ABC transporter permease subunit n=1 Tax=Burkholderia sp. THE68 TaxID=758782 RepID=UPI001316A9B9|nr:branched-chain amino acid ABC transporter permease [Burkholderia sp. THE68]BBU30351.1 branched-chain amino acid ABC transporter permease [Burkholderia sp. THE68]